MPLPLAPIALSVAKIGGVALVAWAVARRVRPARIDQRAEDALDELAEGLSARRPRDRGQTNVAGRYLRRIRVPGASGTFEIDAAFLARLRARKV